LGNEQETAEGFEAVGSQLGASQGKCNIFPKASGGLLAVVGHRFQKEFKAITPHLCSPGS